MNKKTIRDVDVAGKKVLVRVDFNVPLDAEGHITDETRIIAALPTIEYLVGKGAKVILCSHLGRPKGQFKPEFSLAPVAKRLAELVDAKVVFATDVIGESARKAVDEIKEGEIVLLENLRFHKEETDNDPEFAKKLASYADLYVNDAFGTAHRAHASTEGVTHYLPAVAGFLIDKELEFLGGALENPARPFVAILGGAKIADKIPVIDNLFDKVDSLIIGGGMANTFQLALGHDMAKSLIDESSVPIAKELLEKAKKKGVTLMLPIDVCAAKELKAGVETKVFPVEAIPADYMALDIGPATRMLFTKEVESAKTVIWNGPMGVAEIPEFAVGTQAIAQAMADSEATTIAALKDDFNDLLAALRSAGLMTSGQ